MTRAVLRHWNPDILFDKSQVHVFRHQAMHTQFEIRINHEDPTYASQAAHEAFNLVDALENNFSRFVPNSDISRINQSENDKGLVVDLTTFDCLKKSIKIFEKTGSLFDISLGTGLDQLILKQKDRTVTKKQANIKLDLGGIGKGFAVDMMVDLLRDWNIESAFVHGGASSVFACGKTGNDQGWLITVSNPWNKGEVRYHLEMTDMAMASSGLAKGPHILNPKTGKPVDEKRAVWVTGPDAVTADALSTAFMIMSFNEINVFCKKNEAIDALVFIHSDETSVEIHRFGRWPLHRPEHLFNVQ